jgi:DNA-binding NarL/FixJ family response regulator
MKRMIQRDTVAFRRFDPRNGEGMSDDRISDRERQVLSLIVDGFSSKEIGDRLDISMRTVQKHREKIMEKLRVRKATELVKVAITRHLVHN